MSGAEKMRKLMETWKKGVNVDRNVMTVTNLKIKTVETVDEVELVGHEVDHVADGGGGDRGSQGRSGGGGVGGDGHGHGAGDEVREENRERTPRR